MSAGDPRARAEVLKLERALGCEPGRLRALQDADPADLRVLRERLTDALFDAHREGFERIAALSEKVPPQVASMLAQKVLGAPLSARAAALLTPDRAVDLAQRVDADFLTEVAVSVDVRHVGHLVAELGPDTVQEVTAQLAAREEWVVLGGFIGHLSPRALAAAVARLDAEALLRTGFVVEDPGGLDAVVALLDDERLDAIVAVARRCGLEGELDEVVGHLTGEQRARARRARGR